MPKEGPKVELNHETQELLREDRSHGPQPAAVLAVGQQRTKPNLHIHYTAVVFVIGEDLH